MSKQEFSLGLICPLRDRLDSFIRKYVSSAHEGQLIFGHQTTQTDQILTTNQMLDVYRLS